MRLERLNAIKDCFQYLPADLSSQIEEKMLEVLTLQQNRESRGLTAWDTAAASYARKLEAVSKGLFASVMYFAEMVEKNSRADLSRIIMNQIEPFLAKDLSSAEYHPIDHTSYPNADAVEYCPSTGVKITNRHFIDGVEVFLTWSYRNDEPSYWHSKHEGSFGLSEISPEHAVEQCIGLKKKWDDEDRKMRNENFSMDSLNALSNLKIRSIARVRDIGDSRKRKITTLKGDILEQQRSISMFSML